MRAVRSRNTGPELEVRRLLTRLGYRYRLHRKDIPGTPDIAFVGQRKAIFVNGCFWHGHDCPRGGLPRANADFWRANIARNRLRDEETGDTLTHMGWQRLVVWECELNDLAALRERLVSFLG